MILKHTTLYAKGWYLKTDLVSDLKVMLTADGYIPSTASDIVNILVDNIVPFYCKKRPAESLMMQILSDADPKNVWKVGYVEKEYKYHEAVLSSLLSVLSTSSVAELDGLPEPDYTLLPKHYEDFKYEMEYADEGEDENIPTDRYITKCKYSHLMIGSVWCTLCTNFVSRDEKHRWVVCKGIEFKKEEKLND